MEFKEILTRRRMVRHYTPDPIERATLERIVATVRRAPSGGYSQGQRLVVVTDEAKRRAIAELLEEPRRTAEGFEPWIESAPALIVVCSCEQDYHERYRSEDKLQDGEEIEWPVPFWFVDAGAVLMLVLLAAIDEGLAAGVFGIPVEHSVAFRESLAIPDDIMVVAGVTVGRGAEDPHWSASASRRSVPRRELSEVVHWDRW